ncbi:homeobox protein MOX-1 [Oenanthe melanoleuca]|uniref:homeobox protein MOX-1 n=1 Tax=Oenanthe melanoleuca TaxID=2939378 RepID=UPI0024C20187|nr:homeobox protein MOX-1 [Oenanthe melanoleuca]
MDPSGSSCMRSAQPPALLWGCARSSHSDLAAAPGLSHYPAAPFSFQQKPHLAAYSDFSASCLVAAPHSFPQEEQHAPFQRSEWHLAATRATDPALALASGESGGSSPSPVSVPVAAGEDDEAAANPTSDSEKKPSKRKKERAGR